MMAFRSIDRLPNQETRNHVYVARSLFEKVNSTHCQMGALLHLNGPRGYQSPFQACSVRARGFGLPDDLPDEQVASFFINPASAIVMLRHVLAIPQGALLLGMS